ncbi:MAG: hypothetical protein NTY01_18535, partial [Verrucomicrobia bacterium]|nr:hypothetical protein [Verrucomicrobiota bacterium]
MKNGAPKETQVASRFSPWSVALRAVALTGATVAILIVGCVTPAGRDRAPLFSFLQLNDTHVDADAGKDGYEKANEKARWLIEAAASGRYFARPDFVV